MLDIRFVRENPELVKENMRKKFQDHKLVLVDEVIALDKENRNIKQEVESLRANKNKKNLVYLQSTISTDKDGNELELLDFIEDKDVDLYKSYENKKIHENLHNALKTLSSREYDIISRRYGLNREAQTQKEIASEMKISRSYVSRIEKRALLKLYFLMKDQK